MVNLMNLAVVVAAVACCLHSAQAVDREDLAEAIARADVVSSSTSTARNLERKLAFRSAGRSDEGAFDEVCAQFCLHLGTLIHTHMSTLRWYNSFYALARAPRKHRLPIAVPLMFRACAHLRCCLLTVVQPHQYQYPISAGKYRAGILVA